MLQQEVTKKQIAEARAEIEAAKALVITLTLFSKLVNFF